jgi:hypothetical protein
LLEFAERDDDAAIVTVEARVMQVATPADGELDTKEVTKG